MFRCKSLATIYNFFEIENNKVKIKRGKMNELSIYISDSEKFSNEHFIINESGIYTTGDNLLAKEWIQLRKVQGDSPCRHIYRKWQDY
jgi:hypothetical protein